MAIEIHPGPGWWREDDGDWHPPNWEYVEGAYRNLSKEDRQKMIQDLNTMGDRGWEAFAMTGAGEAIAPIHILYRRIKMSG